MRVPGASHIARLAAVEPLAVVAAERDILHALDWGVLGLLGAISPASDRPSTSAGGVGFAPLQRPGQGGARARAGRNT